MEKTEYARKLDSNGRLVIPSKLRDRMELKVGEIYEFFIHEENDKTFLCIECPVKNDLAKAIEVLQKQGLQALPIDEEEKTQIVEDFLQ